MATPLPSTERDPGPKQTLPDTVTFTRIETYRGSSWWQAIWGFLKAKRTGSIELHCSQGAVAVVQFKEHEKRGNGACIRRTNAP